MPLSPKRARRLAMSARDAFAPAGRRQLVLKNGRERVVANRHPWIFAGAIAGERGPENAAVADLVDERGTRLASGIHSLHSQIRMRALAFAPEEFTPELLEERLARALDRRAALFSDETTAARLIHAEGDDLSGLVVDRYGDFLVVEITAAGLEALRPLIVDALQRLVRPRGIFFKNDLPVRKLERLSMEPEWSGSGEPRGEIAENGLRFMVDAREGQKTGFFLDQRANRQLIRSLSPGRAMLNLFSYTGAFGVYAAAGGAASVDEVDVSAAAIEGARLNHELNGQSEGIELHAGDAFQFVRQTRGRWDLVVCDPPAFVKNRGDIDRAARGYKDVNLYALRLTRPGGMLMTFSCSGHMSIDLFQKIIFAAALDAGRRVSFVGRLTAGADHPVSLYCPEGEYLKGLLVEVHD
jgi:23S rRNA (cytosine1962-C5)-methyltransferase